MSDVLTDAQVAAALADLPGWAGNCASIHRAVEFPTFPAAIDGVVAVGEAAEELNHHPDMDIRWRTVTFTLSTHSAGGVTALDIDLARRIDEITR